MVAESERFFGEVVETGPEHCLAGPNEAFGKQDLLHPSAEVQRELLTQAAGVQDGELEDGLDVEGIDGIVVVLDPDQGEVLADASELAAVGLLVDCLLVDVGVDQAALLLFEPRELFLQKRPHLVEVSLPLPPDLEHVSLRACRCFFLGFSRASISRKRSSSTSLWRLVVRHLWQW